jgi:UDP-N-acetylglucosamine 2-epimerase
MEKYTFSSVLILSEAGLNERIALQLAHQKQISVCLLQHGVNYDTKQSYDMNVAQGAFPIKSDYFLCWGKVTEKYSKSLGIKSEKIYSIGSPIFDRLRFDEQNSSKNDCVLFATAGPTKEDASDLTIEIIEKYMNAVKKICQLVTKYNKKLIIKTHPSPDELDPSFIAKQINSKIKVIKGGNISPLIQSCDLMIVTDLSSPILDAHILERPVILLSVKDNGWGIPTAFKNNSCLVTDLEKLDDDLKSVLNNERVRNQLIINGTKSSKEYLSYQNNGSKELIKFLEKLVN